MRIADAMRQKRSIRDTLRLHTQDVHQQLHEHSHFVALFSGEISPDQYCALMRAFHGFYTPLERAIDHAQSQITAHAQGFRYVKRANLLAQDLASLGHSVQDIDQNPQCPQIARIVTSGSLAGVLYVIEGSTLGAAQIDRAAQRTLGADTTDGRRFWAWSRANNKDRWADINAYLEHLERTDHPMDALIKGANDTFAALATWLAPLDMPQPATAPINP